LAPNPKNMPPRCFINSLPDFRAGAQVQIPAQTVLGALKAALDFVFEGTNRRPFVYTGEPEVYTGDRDTINPQHVGSNGWVLGIDLLLAPSPACPKGCLPGTAGAAGLAYTCFHVHRHSAAVEQVIGEAELVEAAVQLSRSALKEADMYPLRNHGWALLGGGRGRWVGA
jgi:hypothetical protein